jgi:hypothetical protein
MLQTYVKHCYGYIIVTQVGFREQRTEENMFVSDREERRLENSGEARHIFTIRQTLERSSQEGWTHRVTTRGKCGAMLAKFLSIYRKTRHSLKT